MMRSLTRVQICQAILVLTVVCWGPAADAFNCQTNQHVFRGCEQRKSILYRHSDKSIWLYAGYRYFITDDSLQPMAHPPLPDAVIHMLDGLPEETALEGYFVYCPMAPVPAWEEHEKYDVPACISSATRMVRQRRAMLDLPPDRNAVVVETSQKKKGGHHEAAHAAKPLDCSSLDRLGSCLLRTGWIYLTSDLRSARLLIDSERVPIDSRMPNRPLAPGFYADLIGDAEGKRNMHFPSNIQYQFELAGSSQTVHGTFLVCPASKFDELHPPSSVGPACLQSGKSLAIVDRSHVKYPLQ